MEFDAVNGAGLGVGSHDPCGSYCKTGSNTGRGWLTRLVLAIVAACVLTPTSAAAQYFGRNKVQYRTFDFRVLATEHFDVYYYPEEAEAARIAGRMAERWYARLSRFFSHELRGRQALISTPPLRTFARPTLLRGRSARGPAA
jgi:hypothetical protein